jgi:hypothetical protein
MATDLTVDQLLAQQQEMKPQATLEPVEGKPEVVKVTPWLPATGCLCHLALVLPKTAIASVRLTGEVHYCCAKRLQVVEVTFAKGAQVSVTEVFSQVVSSASSPQHGPPMPSAAAGAGAPAGPCDGCYYANQLYQVGAARCDGNHRYVCSYFFGKYSWTDYGPNSC